MSSEIIRTNRIGYKRMSKFGTLESLAGPYLPYGKRTICPTNRL